MRLTGIIVASLAVAACNGSRLEEAAESSVSLSALMATADIGGYERAVQSRPLRFPQDHGSHPRFKTEWWYFTGNLENARGDALGFQLTFFRFAITPRTAIAGSPWRSHDAWMGHLAITDVARGSFASAERFSRDGLELAGNSTNPFRLWIEDWSAVAAGSEPFPLQLSAAMPEGSLDLTLSATREPAAHGERGLDQKGSEPGNASYYYSVPRLATRGEIRLGENRHIVTGSAWMDREWSSNALSPDLEGWDWLALELSDGRDLMLYRLRTKQGASSPFSSGTIISRDGSTINLTSDDIALEAREFWTSPASGHAYPVAWQVTVPTQSLELEVRALIPNQEMDLSVRYWEGAVAARGSSAGAALTGRGYLELTGY